MEQSVKTPTNLFDVYLRLRPSSATDRERFLDVEFTDPYAPTHITVKPNASDNRKRAVERFAFTKVFEEHAGQRELFESTGTLKLVEGVLGGLGRDGRDGLVATLGATGSGKSHTILGSKSQRGLTQLALEVLFRHVEPHIADVDSRPTVLPSLSSCDIAESQLVSATAFLDSIYTDGGISRAATPARGMTPARGATPGLDTSLFSPSSLRRLPPRLSALAQYPPVDDINLEIDCNAEYAIIISMYEVHNDRIFDLLASSSAKSSQKRRALLFKSTEMSPHRKVVAGLKKIICCDLEEALLVLETGLQERRVAGTGLNAVSSRSHGFFCIEVKKRNRGVIPGKWSASTLTIVDLAGSERARTAKTAGATLAEAGKINESLMYLGQCMQMQSDNANGNTSHLVPFRQCKLTELLFSNSLISIPGSAVKPPQKSIMIVTADPLGDFNATSQIMRYSALAREVTVPRIPSVTSTILSHGTSGTISGRSSPTVLRDELEVALMELARVRADLEVAQVQLEEETYRRQQAEASWAVAESRLEDIEAEVREEVYEEMEARLAQEQRRWRAARDEELDMQDEHVDRKLEILARGLTVDEAPDADKENMPVSSRLEELTNENDTLKQKLVLMEREKGLRSPSKKMRVLKTRRWEGSGMGLDDE